MNLNMRQMPRGIFAVRAQASTADMIQQLTDAHNQFREKHERRYEAIEAHLDQLAVTNAAERLGHIGSSSMPIDASYTENFSADFRRGARDAESQLSAANAEGMRATIQASMTSGTPSDGGYLAPVEWDREVRMQQREVSPMRQIAQVQTTSKGEFSTLWTNDTFGSGWAGETASRPATTTPNFSQLTFKAHNLYAMPAATQDILDDSEINLSNWLSEGVQREFARQEGIAFVSGDGVNKPRGFLTYVPGGANEDYHPGGNIETLNSGSATDIPNGDALINFKYSLTAPYRQNARWVMNSQTAALIAKMKDGDGNFVWREGLIADEPSTLLGRPVTIDENMPNVAGGATPVAFGDFRSGYLVNDRIGIRVLRDPYTNKPFVMFYTTKRVGGGVLDPNAIKLLKIATAE